MQKNESGQIIVILAVALVAILGITALAVDGSMIYAERRNDQTTADSAAMAGAQAAASSATCAAGQSQAIYSAQQYASQQEGVALVNNASSPNRVEATCNADNSKLTVKVVVTSNTPTTFAKMVSRNQLQTRVESTSQVTFGSGEFAGGSGLVSLGTTCDANGGIYSLGGSKINVSSGGVFSSSCLKVTGSSYIFSANDPIFYTGKGATQFTVGTLTEYTGANGIIFDGTAPVFIKIDPDLTAPSGLQYNANTNTPNTAIPQSEWPIPTSVPITVGNIPVMTPISEPVCGPATSASPSPSSAKIYPGTYTSLTWNSDGSGNLTFDPGVYCFSGALNLYGGSSTAKVIMDGVTLYFTSSSGNDFSSWGNFRFSFENGIFYSKKGNFRTSQAFTANNSKFYLESGNFTLDGSAIMTMNNSSIYMKNGILKASAGAKFNATNITMYIKQGDFTIEGGAKVNLSAPNCSNISCGVGPAIQGVLLYMDKLNTGSLNINNGTDDAYKLNGTIYAPNALAYFTGGTKTNAINVQLIAKRIEVREGAVLNMDISSAILYTTGGPSSVELLK
jgi:hypothetical protein